MTKKYVSCYACEFSYRLVDTVDLLCGKNLPGCPHVGSQCRSFQRYPGAPDATDEAVEDYLNDRLDDDNKTR